ncbi:sulfotransferase domain-containing protein [Patescibacteria group bacterium]|nr:sulfotransferase domain-containing protein [Patescibacteria group bacterium]MBU1673239.1 sulfotransferase domain-containing protein [Patescibacteria group bacterium]MBU1964003.1 sulfotransferase domain-containing protein [Patescibacteria group bacterium]
MNNSSPILITGGPRSGSTWAGKIISKSPEVGYIHEPFNLKCHPGICNCPIDKWFFYVNEINEHEFSECFNRTLHYEYNTRAQLSRSLTVGAKQWLDWQYYRITNKRPLIKDPIAIFSTEWLVKNFNMKPVILIRHPAAFISSRKKLNWAFPAKDILSQPELMKKLGPFKEEIEKQAVQKHDIIDQGILTWNLMYYFINELKEKHDEWLFIRYEDLAKDPLKKYAEIFTYLDLDFSKKIKNFILDTTRGKEVEVAVEDRHAIKLNTAKALNNWKKRLSEQEIEKIKIGTDPYWKYFYKESDWTD